MATSFLSFLRGPQGTDLMYQAANFGDYSYGEALKFINNFGKDWYAGTSSAQTQQDYINQQSPVIDAWLSNYQNRTAVEDTLYKAGVVDAATAMTQLSIPQTKELFNATLLDALNNPIEEYRELAATGDQYRTTQARIAEQSRINTEQAARQQQREDAAQARLAEQEAATKATQERAAAATEQQRKSQIRLDNTRGLSNAVGIKVGTNLDSRENRNAVQYQSASDQNRGVVSSGVDLNADDTQGPRKTRRGLSSSLGINV